MPAVGVKLVVSEVFPQIAMKTIGSRFYGRIHDPAHIVTEFSRRILGNQVEFLDCVGRGRVSKQVVGYLVVVHSVQKEIVCLLTISID